MSVLNAELDRQGGSVNYAIGQLMTSQEADRMGGMANQTLMHLFLLLFRNEVTSFGMTGFPEEGGHCLVTADAGDLDVIVSSGLGWYYDGVSTPDEFGHVAYQMIVNEANESLSHDAHDANPRVDLIVIETATVDDETAIRSIKNPSTLVISSASVDLRTRFSSTISIVKGTAAASPATPAVPSGKTLLATVEIPATSGARTIHDGRELVSFGHLYKAHPSEAYIESWIPDAASDYVVEETSPTGLSVILNGGVCVEKGQAYRHATNLRRALAAADPTNPRIDSAVIVGGIYTTITGTPAASPVQPAVAAGALRVANIAVAALATTIVNANITDLRGTNDYGAPLSGSKLKLASTNYEKLSVDTLRLAFGVSAPSGDDIGITVQIKSVDDINPLQSTASRQFWAEVYDDNGDLATDVDLFVSTSATAVSTDGQARLLWTSTADVVVPQLTATRTSAPVTGTYHVFVHAVNEPCFKGYTAITFV